MKQTVMKTLVLAMLAFAVAASTVHAQDLLPFWNDSAAKKSVMEFVAKVAKEGSPNFVPSADRIATFDNDGTLHGNYSSNHVHFIALNVLLKF